MHILIFPSKIWGEKCTLYMAKYSNWTQSINYAIKYLNFKSKNINFKKKICQSWVRVGGAYLLSGTAQSSPGLRRPFLWETGSPESSVTKETSKRGCQKSLSWLVGKSAYRQTHMVCSVMRSQGLNHRNGRAKDSLRSSCPPRDTAARVTCLMTALVTKHAPRTRVSNK